jgi:hypothetical protein
LSLLSIQIENGRKIMEKTKKQTSTKLLVIAITAVAILAAITTISITGATTAFAAVNCNPDNTVCSGGNSHQTEPGGINGPEGSVGGCGGHTSEYDGGSSATAGCGTLSGGFVGGEATHRTCVGPPDPDEQTCTGVGGSGLHTPNSHTPP